MYDRRRKQRPVLVSAPTSAIMTLAEAKAQCRVDGSDDDNLINGLILAVTSYLDTKAGITGRALLRQTWRQDFYGWPNSYNGLNIPVSSNAYDYPWQQSWSPYAGEFGLRLPMEPVASISSVKYYDAANVLQTVNPSFYDLYTDELGPYCRMNPSTFVWPSIYVRPDAVQVTFLAGDTAVNPAIKQAALLLVQHWFQLSVSAGTGGSDTQNFQAPPAVDALLSNAWRPTI